MLSDPERSEGESKDLLLFFIRPEQLTSKHLPVNNTQRRIRRRPAPPNPQILHVM